MSGQARENILGKIRKALSEHSVEMPFPEADKASDFFVKEELTAEEKFAKEFTLLGGKFVYCGNEAELLEHLQALADTMKWPTIHSKDRDTQKGKNNILAIAIDVYKHHADLCNCVRDCEAILDVLKNRYEFDCNEERGGDLIFLKNDLFFFILFLKIPVLLYLVLL